MTDARSLLDRLCRAFRPGGSAADAHAVAQELILEMCLLGDSPEAAVLERRLKSLLEATEALGREADMEAVLAHADDLERKSH